MSEIIGSNVGSVNAVPQGAASEDSLGVDLATLRELSVEPEEATSESRGVEQEPKHEPSEEASDDESGEVEDDGGEELDSEAGEEEDSSDSSEDSPRFKGAVKFSHDGKEFEIPKDAKIPVNINGKREKLPLQEILNRASGSVHIGRESSRLGRERKDLETRQSQFMEYVRQVENNSKYLIECAKDPMSFAEAVAELTNQDPDVILDQLTEGTIKYIKEASQMSERERALMQENRKYTRERVRRELQEKVQQESAAVQQKRVALDKSLEKIGLSADSFDEAISELQSLARNNEEFGFGLDEVENLSENDVIRWMHSKDVSNRLDIAIQSVNPRLAEDADLLDRAISAVVKTESLYGKLSNKELKQVVNGFVTEEKKVLSESLSKKAKAASKRANSQEDDGSDVFTLAQYMEARRGY